MVIGGLTSFMLGRSERHIERLEAVDVLSSIRRDEQPRRTLGAFGRYHVYRR